MLQFKKVGNEDSWEVDVAWSSWLHLGCKHCNFRHNPIPRRGVQINARQVVTSVFLCEPRDFYIYYNLSILVNLSCNTPKFYIIV